jgi:hypothetical protein
VSLSCCDRHALVLTPERASLIRRRRGWNGPYDLKIDAPCQDPTPAAAARALADLVGKPEIGGGTATLLLSSHFVRYLLIPWKDEVHTPGELEAFAHICCEQVYGGDPARRVLRISRGRPGSPRLAAFLEADFLAELENILAKSRLRLTSVQPYLPAVYNRLLHRLPRRDFLFLVAEPARACLLAAAGGAWTSVRASSGEDSPRALARLIERECQLLGLETDTLPPVFIHAPRQARLRLEGFPGPAPTPLALPIPAALAGAADHLLAMAMAVI